MQHSMPRLPSRIAAWTVFAIAVGGLSSSAVAQADNKFYAGKSIKVIVGLEAGGTVDTFVRGFSLYLRKHIPGNPTIIVQNMPGGGTYTSLNFLGERAPADAMTIVYNPCHPLGQAYGDIALRARYDSFAFLGGLGDTR